ncbi:hypothetical protein RUM43_009751 [Polyplax serrata]|uniref:Uncharacterized protein n=1 Tax=Polyplax serrata TaxID=468196 RepID=A0AAN8S4G2_POLSC
MDKQWKKVKKKDEDDEETICLPSDSYGMGGGEEEEEREEPNTQKPSRCGGQLKRLPAQKLDAPSDILRVYCFTDESLTPSPSLIKRFVCGDGGSCPALYRHMSASTLSNLTPVSLSGSLHLSNHKVWFRQFEVEQKRRKFCRPYEQKQKRRPILNESGSVRPVPGYRYPLWAKVSLG